MRKLLWLAIILAVTPRLAEAETQIRTPGCDAIIFWAAQVDPADTYNVAPKLALPKAFQDVYMVPTFGAPALSWTVYDVEAVNQAFTACLQDAAKRRDQIAANALTSASRVLVGVLPRTIDALHKASTDAEPIARALAALPPLPELARGIDALLKANLAAPDMNLIRGLPRAVSDPIWRLAQVAQTLSVPEREAIWATLGERRRTIEVSVATEAVMRIASAPADAGGVLTLMEVGQRVSALTDPEMAATLNRDAEEKARQIRETLHQAKPPAWAPPTCLDLYRWSGTPNAGGVVTLGRRGVPMALLDERAIPVFGTSVGDWTDEDLARFKTLRGFCKAASLPRKGVPAAPGSEADELLRTANRGRWIEGADQPIAEARIGVAEYHKARQELAALSVKLRALPNTAASLSALAVFLNDPVLAAVSQEDRTAFAGAAAEKRAAIGGRLTEGAVKGLDGVRVGSMADLEKLFQYAAQASTALPDQRGQQAFAAAFAQKLEETAQRLRPEFQAKLAAIPATLEGIEQVKAADAALGDTGRAAAMRPFHDDAGARIDAIVGRVRERSCADLLSGLGIGGDVSLKVWDGDDGVTLGAFVCGLAEHGATVSAWSGAGMFSSTATLKLAPARESIMVVSLREAEVKAGRSMLVGVKIADANGRAAGGDAEAKDAGALTTAGWEGFARLAKTDGPWVPEACKAVLARAPGKSAAEIAGADKGVAGRSGPGETLFRLHCRALADPKQAVAGGTK